MTELQEARKDGFHSAQEEEFTEQCKSCLWWYDPKNLTCGICSPNCLKECEGTVPEETLKEINRDRLEQKVRDMLIHYHMENPCLGVEEDYLPTEERLAFYTKIVNEAETSTLIEELTDLQLKDM